MKYTSRNPNGINQITGSAVAVTVLNNDVAVFTTSSLELDGALTASSAIISGNVIVQGTASINTLVVNQTQYTSGSNQLGDGIEDTQTLFGTVRIPTGSLTVTGSSIMSGSLVVTGGITGSLFGTASYVPTLQEVTTAGSSTSTTVTIRGTQISEAGNVHFLTAGYGSSGQFQLRTAAGSVDAIRVTNTGLTGIGTTSPSAKLHAVGSGTTSATTTLLIENLSAAASLTVKDDLTTTFGGNLFTANDSVISGSFGYSGGDYIRIHGLNANGQAKIASYDYGTQRTTELAFGSGIIHWQGLYKFSTNGYYLTDSVGSLGSYERLRIDYLGRVGISNPNPAYRLDVSGSGNFTDNLTVTGSLTVITGSAIEFQVNQTGVKIGNAPTDSHSVTGSVAISSSASTSSAALLVYKSGSTVIDIQGSTGQLFSITDSLTGSLFSVNTVAGLPIIEAFSDNTVNIGKFGSYPIKVVASGTLASITGSFSGSLVGSATSALTASYVNPLTQSVFISGSVSLRGSQAITGSLEVLGGITGSLFGTASHAILPDGNLQVSGGVALDGTLRPLEDQQGNVSPLRMSTQYVTGYQGDITNVVFGPNAGNISSGTNNTAIGYNAIQDLGNRSNTVIIGVNASGNSPNLVVIGVSAAGRNQSTVVGASAGSNTDYITAVGYGATANNYGASLGIGTNASGQSSVALGRSALSSGTNSISLGALSDATATDAIAIGNIAQATGPQSLSIGYNSLASGTGSIALGSNLTASQDETLYTRNANFSGSVEIYKSGSTVMSIQGSQGELFSITDSLSGSLFSVSNISGLPILEVFSDNTVLLGSYLDPMLITTQRLTANSGSTTIYSLPTASYDGIFVDYVIRSGSDARAGQIMGMWSGSTATYVDNSTTDFGSTSGFTFGLIITGSNMVLTGSASTSGWTVRAGIRSI